MTILADGLRSLRTLGWAKRSHSWLLAVLMGLSRLLPAATAVILAVLVRRFETEGATLPPLAAALTPLAAFVAVLLLGHVMDTVLEPLGFLVQTTIDGVHRASITELVSSTPTIDKLETPQARTLIRAAKADPENWTEHTPGEGAVAVLRILAGLLGVAGSCVVLAGYAWWLVPVVLVPALINWALRQRQALRYVRTWRSGTVEGAKAQMWQDSAISPGAWLERGPQERGSFRRVAAGRAGTARGCRTVRSPAPSPFSYLPARAARLRRYRTVPATSSAPLAAMPPTTLSIPTPVSGMWGCSLPGGILAGGGVGLCSWGGGVGSPGESSP